MNKLVRISPIHPRKEVYDRAAVSCIGCVVIGDKPAHEFWLTIQLADKDGYVVNPTDTSYKLELDRETALDVFNQLRRMLLKNAPLNRAMPADVAEGLSKAREWISGPDIRGTSCGRCGKPVPNGRLDAVNFCSLECAD